MSKSTRMTPAMLEAMNLEEVSPGVYAPKKKEERHNEPKRLSQASAVKSVTQNDATSYHMGSDTRNQAEKYIKHANSLTDEESKAEIRSMKDLISNPKPFDIAAIRALGSGTKKRKQSMEDLHRFAKELVEGRPKGVIWIKGNVASSKNSKEIAKFKKRVNGKLVEMTSLIDSKATRKYRKETAGQWNLNRSVFEFSARGKEYPIHLEFTFIRDSLRRFDLINAAQIICDTMVETGYIEDDSSEHIIPHFNPVVYYSSDYAGVLIKVL